MPTQTPNLKLDTYNNTTDSQSKFQTFRTSIAGDQTSNMTKIDKWAGDVNTKLTSLENNKPTILVKANWISVGYYEAISEDIVDFKLDMLVTVKLNQDNDGTLTMKINDLTVKSFLKYDTTGTLVNLDVGDLRKDREYQFRYDGTAFVWQGGTSADQLNIVGTVGNIVSVADDNTIKDSGVSVGTGALSTTDKTVVGGINELDTKKIDKTQIKNTLTETVEGNVLDATQGKILDDKFSILSHKPKKNTLAMLDDLPSLLGITPQNNMIFGCLYQETSAPYLYSGAWYDVTEYYYTNLYRTQIAQATYGNGNQKQRKMVNGVWSSWVEYATTEKIDILCTQSVGIVIKSQACYMVNNVVYWNIFVERENRLPFEQNVYYEIATVPSGTHNSEALSVSFHNDSYTTLGSGSANIAGNNKIYALSQSTAEVKEMRISGVSIL